MPTSGSGTCGRTRGIDTTGATARLTPTQLGNPKSPKSKCVCVYAFATSPHTSLSPSLVLTSRLPLLPENRESSLFHKHKPVVSYGYDELDEPMHNGTVSMWEMCAGLLGNIHFTMPLEMNSRGQYVPTTLKSSSRTAYSPYTPSNTPNLTALEDFILQISRDAFEVSPFYRHYGMFHLASDSGGCPDYAWGMQNGSSSNTVPDGSTYTFMQQAEAGHGASSSSYHLTSGSRLENFTISRYASRVCIFPVCVYLTISKHTLLTWRAHTSRRRGAHMHTSRRRGAHM